jgi:hypothetical protein
MTSAVLSICNALQIQQQADMMIAGSWRMLSMVHTNRNYYISDFLTVIEFYANVA